MHRQIILVPRLRTAAAFACGIALSLTACDNGNAHQVGASSTPLPSPTSLVPVPDSALCADADALRASLDALATVTIAPGVSEELRADLDAVKANLSAVVTDARGHWQAQTDALRSALSGLETAAGNLVASPSPASAAPVRSALDSVTAAARDLSAALNQSCPSTPSSSPSSR